MALSRLRWGGYIQYHDSDEGVKDPTKDERHARILMIVLLLISAVGMGIFVSLGIHYKIELGAGMLGAFGCMIPACGAGSIAMELYGLPPEDDDGTPRDPPPRPTTPPPN